MSQKILRCVVTIVALALSLVLGYLLLQQFFSRSERLVWAFQGDLSSREFTAMYHKSSDHTKVNVSEAEFVRRMTIVSKILAEYDPDIELRRNIKLEDRFRQIRIKSGDPDPPYYSFAILEIGTPEKTAQILISWVRNGIEPKFFDLSIGDADLGLTNRINTVAGKPFMSGE